jgi:virginiamycin B lyase
VYDLQAALGNWVPTASAQSPPTGVIEVYDLPPPGSEPHGTTLRPDHALWTALEIDALARITA